jgi:dTDP-4-dehydrorhamnose reductase
MSDISFPQSWNNIRVVLVLGARGMLGSDLIETFCIEPWTAITDNPTLYAWDLDELDITRPDQVAMALEKLKPQVVINCAAYTDVDGCETRQDLAMAVNAGAPGHLAQVCRSIHARLVHISTDYVFNGKNNQPYLPDDTADPINIYGRSKWQGEQNIRAALEQHIIIRTSWLFGPQGKNFVKTIRTLAAQRDHLDVVNDQIGCPTFTIDLAEAILRLISSDTFGTFHFHNHGQCSWYEFACEIIGNISFLARCAPPLRINSSDPPSGRLIRHWI